MEKTLQTPLSQVAPSRQEEKLMPQPSSSWEVSWMIGSQPRYSLHSVKEATNEQSTYKDEIHRTLSSSDQQPYR